MRYALILCAASTLFAQGTPPLGIVNQKGTLAAKPAKCTTGQLYFATDQAAGSNLYGCNPANTWTLQSGGGGSTAPLTLVPTAISIPAPVLVNSGSTGSGTCTYLFVGYSAAGKSISPTTSINNCAATVAGGYSVQATMPTTAGILKYQLVATVVPSDGFPGIVPDNGGAQTTFTPGQVVHDITTNVAPFAYPITDYNGTAGIGIAGSLRVNGYLALGPDDTGLQSNMCPEVVSTLSLGQTDGAYFPYNMCSLNSEFGIVNTGNTNSGASATGHIFEYIFTGSAAQDIDNGILIQTEMRSPFVGTPSRLIGIQNIANYNGAGAPAAEGVFGQINEAILSSGSITQQSLEAVRSIEGNAVQLSTGNATKLDGNYNEATRQNSGDVTVGMVGSTGLAGNNFAGAITGYAAGLEASISGTAATANDYGLVIQTYTSANAAAHQYGIAETVSAHNYLLGNTGIGVDQSATARMELGAGSATIPPFIMDSGTLKSSPASGAIENDGTNFYGTEVGVRHIFLRDQVATCASLSGVAPSCSTDATNASNIASGTLPTGRLTGSYTGITGVGTLTAGATGAGFTMNLATSTISGALPSANAPSALSTGTNCANGAAPAVCGTASSGAVAIPTGVTTVTLTVNTSAVTANSRIFLVSDDSVTISGVTCNNTLATLVGGLAITGRVPGTSFTVTYNGTIAANPLCMSFAVIN